MSVDSPNYMKRKQLGRVVKKLLDTHVELSWIGTLPPSEREEVKAAARSAKRNYDKLLKELFPGEMPCKSN